ncbi:hypothetical protein ACFFLS_18785 [Flavobacterium procerum]|uniref:Secreted protein n=1 Tax=Flavobacterium procerum TaxID=1455569 RepID=A0ABV6BUI3_9FLAO
MINKKFAYTGLCFFLVTIMLQAQRAENLQTILLSERTQTAPEDIFKKFRDAGMNPVNHELTKTEKEKISKAISILPPLHQKVLKDHLHSISFMDNMPNTALTSLLENSGPAKTFNITFRAGILNETISEWATWKENTCYSKAENNNYQVVIEAGEMDAIVYVLLHEATHVVDKVLNTTPPMDDTKEVWPAQTPFTVGIWHKPTEPSGDATNSLLETTRFRSGEVLPISSAPDVYKALQETPFCSLYSMASWSEDLAEMLAIYHLTQKMNQPFKIVVKQDGMDIFTYEPFTNPKVLKRQNNLAVFYES